MIHLKRDRKFDKIEDVPLPDMGMLMTTGPSSAIFEPDLPDKGIQNLVRVLTGLGWTTTMSCEGHLNPSDSNLKKW